MLRTTRTQHENVVALFRCRQRLVQVTQRRLRAERALQQLGAVPRVRHLVGDDEQDAPATARGDVRVVRREVNQQVRVFLARTAAVADEPYVAQIVRHFDTGLELADLQRVPARCRCAVVAVLECGHEHLGAGNTTNRAHRVDDRAELLLDKLRYHAHRAGDVETDEDWCRVRVRVARAALPLAVPHRARVQCRVNRAAARLGGCLACAVIKLRDSGGRACRRTQRCASG